MMKKWKTLSSKYMIRNKYVTIRKDRVRLSNGDVSDYYAEESNGYIAIFCITEDNRVILIREYKHGMGEIITNLITGLLEEDEDPEDAAPRELMEETGYEADLSLIRRIQLNPTRSNGYVYVFLGRNARKTGKPKIDPKEELEFELVPLDSLKEKINSGEINSLGNIAVINVVLDYLKKEEENK